MRENKSYIYGIRLAIIYSFVWFIDLLDASSLNVALPAIAQKFGIDPTHAEWAIVGFLLSMTIGISISSWLGENYGTKKIFLLAQLIYISASIGCGLSNNLSGLVLFRVLQGFSCGMAIPLGMSALMHAMPPAHWAKTSANMNMVTLVAPALGPLFGAYVTNTLSWPWIFFLKLPLSLVCFFLSIWWIKKEKTEKVSNFDWSGFIFGGLSLTLILWVFSEIGKETSPILLSSAFFISLVLAIFFIYTEKKSRHPLVPLAIFKEPHFSYGNLIQSAANTIFLGANFIIALYLQRGLGFSIVKAGWIMAAITPGMIFIQPFVGKFYNRLGPLPFIIPGLALLAFSTFAFAFTSSATSPFFLGMLVFLIGSASSLAQTANVSSIFSCLSSKNRGAGSSVYSLFKQISASFGIAISTMVLSLGGHMHKETISTESLSSFHLCFLVLGAIPLLSLGFCFFINNSRAISEIKTPRAIPTQELGAE